jgi:MarR family transcriptional regulator, lower aerobic nicotinate degradation pathway regulator
MAPRRDPAAADRPVRVVSWSGGAPIRRVPIALARRFAQICVAVAAETLEGENLTPLQFAVLANLDDKSDVDQNSLAARLGVDRNSASVLVEQLEKRGLIDRRINGADRRARLLRLTAIGNELHERLRPPMRASQRRILAALPPAERERFLDQLVQIIKANESYARPGAARRKRGATTSTVEMSSSNA